MKNIAVFGATGTIGTSVVGALLDKGLKVRALIRNSANLPKEYQERVEVVRGDVLNVLDVKAALEGQHAAIVVIGPRNTTGSTVLISEGLKNILAAMNALNISVVSICLSTQIFMEPRKLLETHRDQQRAFKLLDYSDLHWIVVTAPSSINTLPSGYCISRGASSKHSTISKHDLAAFLVDCLFMPEHYQKTVAVSSNPRRQKLKTQFTV